MHDFEIGKASISADMYTIPPAVVSLHREVEKARAARFLPPVPAKDLFGKPLLWRDKYKAPR